MPAVLTTRYTQTYGSGGSRTPRGRTWTSTSRRWATLFCLMLLALGGRALFAQAPPTYQIQTVAPASVPAGANGATLALSGTLPDFTLGTYQVCFFTGAGSTAALTPTVAGGTATITVPASTIQSIPAANFNSADGFAAPALVYVVPADQVCGASADPALTNTITVPVVEPTLGPYTGPTSIPQMNPAATTPSVPTLITLTGSNFAAATTVSFGSLGSVVPKLLTPSALSVALPTGFASSPPGTTASLSVCNTVGTATFCSTPATPITLTVAAQVPSTATITALPSPVTVGGQTTLTARYIGTGGQGAPSGTVTFVADSMTLPAAPLILDPTATFVAQTTTVVTPVAATPTITPVAGSYTATQTIVLADATPGALIYYTQDGSTPTTASTLYTGPFRISTTQTITAIAAVAGFLNSATAASAYTITISPPVKLAFLVAPVSTPVGTAIAPAIQVALEDVDGNTVGDATNAVSLTLASNPGDTTLAGTTTVNAVNGIATFPDISLNTIATGYTLAASSGRLTPATSAPFNITPYPITLTVQSELIGIGSTLTGTFTLGKAAPAGGLVVTLSSSAPANATIAPPTVTVAAGQTTGNFTYTGVAAGNATLSAAATNYQTGTVVVTGTAAQVSLGSIPPVAPGQTVSLALSLPMAAPAGGTTVTFTSSNTAVATVTSTIFVPEGQRTASSNPQIVGVVIGTTTVIASAPGFAPDSRAVNVTVTATFTPNPTYINLATSTTTTLNISAPAPVGGIKFTLTSDDPTIATLPASITIAQGATSVVVPITGIVNGSTTIRADSPNITEATVALNVNSTIGSNGLSTGVKLENSAYYLFSLPVAPPHPVTVTFTVSDPRIATIGTDGTKVGVTTLTIPNISSGGYLPTIFIQGQSVGTTTITASAPGYTTGTSTITVNPSGFFIGDNINTTTFSAPTGFTVASAMLNPTTLTYGGYLPLNPGVSAINVSLTNSAPSIGTISAGSVTFHGGDSQQSATFQPVAAGATTISIGAVTGFSTPSTSQQITATVTEPAIGSNSLSTGVKLQNSAYYLFSLPVAPPHPVTVTFTVSDPRIAKMSLDGTMVGVTTLMVPNVSSGGYLPTFFVQGQSVGTTTITATAPGYTSATSTITVNPSGFFITDNNFNTTTFSGVSAIHVAPAMLNPGTLTYAGYLGLSPGVGTVTATLANSSNAIGTISATTLTFHSGDGTQSFNFQPVAAGMTTVSLAPVAGFSTPSTNQQITATVTAPAISANNLSTGVKLENNAYYLFFLPVAPPRATTVTVTISDPRVATISLDGTAVGVTTLTIPNITASGYLPTIYVQGQSVGTATITATATGYTSATGTITVNPSGFFINANSFNTTTFSGVSTIPVAPAMLNPGALTYAGYLPLSPGVGTVNATVTNSDNSIGTISAGTLVFHAGDNTQSFNFQPVAAGVTTVSLAPVTGFTTPSTNQQITATVTAPQIQVNSILTGVSLQNSEFYLISLPVAPPGPVNVTVTSDGPAIATISASGTVVGGTSLTFMGVSAAGYIPAVYVQGQTTGSTTLTVSAAGYTNGIVPVTVNPSGFAFEGASLTTTVAAGPTQLNIHPYPLNPGSFTIISQALQLNPGIDPVDVDVTSSSPAVGTISTSPLVFNPGDSSQPTNFVPVSSGTTTLTVVPPAGFSTPSQDQQATATVQ